MFAGVLSSDPKTYQSQMTVITITLVIALIWDGLNDPLMGIIIEKCHIKTGKFRPWILYGAIGNAVVVALMFAGFAKDWAYVALMITFYFLWDAVFTMNDIGYWSMLPSLTSDEKERSSITTKVTLATTIGAFSMNLIMMLLPGMIKISTAAFYRWAAIITAILFLLSQASVFFFCKEKKRDPKQEEVSSQTKFKDLFTILKKNKPLLMVVIAMFLYYLSSSLLTGTGLNYFYLAYGYGGAKGGLLASLLSVVFVLATIVSQALYPMIAKKMKKQTILTTTFIIAALGYVAFLILAFPIFGAKPLAYSDMSGATDIGSGIAAVFSGTAWLLFVPAIFFFAAQGVFYLCLLVMMQNSIEYNEWKYGERKESVAFSWRPLDAKFSSAAQKGVQNLMFIIAALYPAVTAISSLESQFNSGEIDAAQMASGAQNVIDTQIPNGSLALFGYLLIGLILAIYFGAYACLHWGYRISEDDYANILKELDIRHQKDEAEAAAKAAEVAPAVDPGSVPPAQ
jgi:Na+/melibiose symporter-like transporter